MRQIYLFFIFIFIFCACQSTGEDASGDPTLRIATFNIEDVRTDDLQRADHPRLQKIAQIIAQIRPDILLINEIA